MSDAKNVIIEIKRKTAVEAEPLADINSHVPERDGCAAATQSHQNHPKCSGSLEHRKH
jgi:hypothetical protein